MTIAFTLGTEINYDEVLAREKNVTKVGKIVASSTVEGYSGGCIFRTIEDALKSDIKLDNPTYAVYAVQLSSSFENCTEKYTYTNKNGKTIECDVLLYDSVILRKVRTAKDIL